MCKKIRYITYILQIYLSAFIIDDVYAYILSNYKESVLVDKKKLIHKLCTKITGQHYVNIFTININ